MPNKPTDPVKLAEARKKFAEANAKPNKKDEADPQEDGWIEDEELEETEEQEESEPVAEEDPAADNELGPAGERAFRREKEARKKAEAEMKELKAELAALTRKVNGEPEPEPEDESTAKLSAMEAKLKEAQLEKLVYKNSKDVNLDRLLDSRVFTDRLYALDADATEEDVKELIEDFAKANEWVKAKRTYTPRSNLAAGQPNTSGRQQPPTDLNKELRKKAGLPYKS